MFPTCSCLKITKHNTKHPKEDGPHFKVSVQNEHVTKKRGRKCGKVGALKGIEDFNLEHCTQDMRNQWTDARIKREGSNIAFERREL